jgi:predicted ATPase
LELVYLWVEDYKNIQKQGFNFSPRFNCHYNEEKNELTIDENDEYIENFFGDNINVTAIVGKNGSGKSSVLEYLSNSPKFTIIFENNKFRTSKNIKVINYTKYSLVQQKVDLEYEYIVSSDYILNNLLKIEYNSSEILNHLKYFLGLDTFDTSDLFILGGLNQLSRQLDTFLNSKNSLKKIIFPKYIILEFNDELSYFPNTELIKELFSKMNFDKNNLFNFIYLSAYERILMLNDKYKNKEFSSLVVTHIINKYSNSLSIRDLFLEFEYQLQDDLFLRNYQIIKEFCYLFDNCKDIYSDNDFCTYDKNTYKAFAIPLEKFNPKILKNKDKDGYFDHTYIDYCKWGVEFSSGEMIFINLLSSIFYIMKKNPNLQYLYIDEGESFLHPNWQKKYLSYIVQFIKDNFPDRKIHIILTSHSPFLLSDIPKQNIIFLDKDQKGNCKVVDGLKEKKQTFGANIHTLLSDSFFMEDGLMGEFAKSKIDKAINLLNQDKLSEEDLKYCEQIISIIGEPIVKNQLQRMLDSKRLKKVDEIDAIKKSMEAMQKRLDELEK